MYLIKGIAILDNDGNRILAKYYDQNILSTLKEQKAFEKNLFTKTHRANAEIIMLDGLTCVYKSNVDLFFYVMGSSHENEVFHCMYLYCTGIRIGLSLFIILNSVVFIVNIHIICVDSAFVNDQHSSKCI